MNKYYLFMRRQDGTWSQIADMFGSNVEHVFDPWFAPRVPRHGTAKYKIYCPETNESRLILLQPVENDNRRWVLQ